MKNKKNRNKADYFLSPDPLMKNQLGSERVQFKVLNQLFPVSFLVYGFLFSVTLFFIPLGTLFLAYKLFDLKVYLLPILLSSSLFFCFYCILFGFLIMNTRIPFLKEWKDKLGFIEG